MQHRVPQILLLVLAETTAFTSTLSRRSLHSKVDYTAENMIDLKDIPMDAPRIETSTNGPYSQIGPTSHSPQPKPLTPQLKRAVDTSTHPLEDHDTELGRGTYILSDWRRTWCTYESPTLNPDLIDSDTGEAFYDIDQIEGSLPDDLQGTLFRNGGGKMGVGEERVAHVLDADGLVSQIRIGPPVAEGEKREVSFRSRFVQTKGFVQELKEQKFVKRGTFGTTPRGQPSLSPRKGVNEDPSTPTLLSRVAGAAFRTETKNTANTHVVSFGGKLLALFQAGLPYSLDPETLETHGEDRLGGLLPDGERLSVKLFNDAIPDDCQPGFLGGASHTCHPKMCPRTGHMVGWHWSMLVDKNALEIVVTEWTDQNDDGTME